MASVSIHTLVKSVTGRWLDFEDERHVSIHTLVKSVTLLFKPPSTIVKKVSIHTLVKSVTPSPLRAVSIVYVSIHTLVKSVTSDGIVHRVVEDRFQSTRS